jgi:hypothetical protein
MIQFGILSNLSALPKQTNSQVSLASIARLSSWKSGGTLTMPLGTGAL